MWKRIKGSVHPGLIVLLVSLLVAGLMGYALAQVSQGASFTSAGATKGIRPFRCVDDGTGRYCYMVTQTTSGVPTVKDDAAFTPGTTPVTPAGFEFDDTTPDSVDEGDVGAARMSGNRNVYVQIRDAAGNERGANVNASNQLGVVEANSGTIAGDTTAIQTAIEIIDGAYAKVDDDSTSNCDDLDTSSEQYTLPTAGDWYHIRVTGNCASILCGSDPTATTAKDGHWIKVCDGDGGFKGPLTGAKCAHIAPTATGEICYVHLNSAL